MLNLVQTKVKQLAEGTDTNSILHQMRQAEYLILEVHRTWQFFRESLIARQGPPFASVLEALDEFAWSCYHPVFAKTPEPPLVFFSAAWSPLALARQHSLIVTQELTDGPAGPTQLDPVRVKQMVIPTVSLPWYATAFLPLVLMLAHEMAHLVDFELGLAENITRNLREAKIDKTNLERYWLPWQAEVFADLYGVLTMGPAYVQALMTLLVHTRNTVLNIADGANKYPTYHFRFLIALDALTRLGFAGQAKDLKEEWQALYGKPTDYLYAECKDDIEHVFKALLETPFDTLGNGKNKGQSLKDLKKVRWSKADQDEAEIFCNRLLNNGALKNMNPRIVMAGAQLAFHKRPDKYLAGSFTADGQPVKVVQQILAGREKGTRSIKQVAQELEKQKPAEGLSEQDRKAGEELARLLLVDIEKELAL
jgi:hypothetical protein